MASRSVGRAQWSVRRVGRSAGSVVRTVYMAIAPRPSFLPPDPHPYPIGRPVIVGGRLAACLQGWIRRIIDPGLFMVNGLIVD